MTDELIILWQFYFVHFSYSYAARNGKEYLQISPLTYKQEFEIIAIN